MYDIIVIGGGIAGLINSILLSRKGLRVALFEKNTYPFHRVCGEYISNEVKPFLIRNELFPFELHPTNISRFKLTSTNGNQTNLPLNMGGFGVSRYTYDKYLFEQAQKSGVEVFEHTKVSDVSFVDEVFVVTANNQLYQSKLVIGAQGKRSNLDKERPFMQKRSPYIGVKYHLKIDLPADQIALHNFSNGYCGISQVEKETFNLCYLSHRENMKDYKSISDMEENVLHENPFLKEIWRNADFLFEKPEVINEISFEKKEPVYNHILMSGDTAGMITPLCGNGMAMAIRSAHLLSETILSNQMDNDFDRVNIEREYTKRWNKKFATRLQVGRQIQKLFGGRTSSNLAVMMAKVKPMGQSIIRLTHGKHF